MAPGGIATPQVYAQLLCLYLLHNDMNNARYLWKRIPQAIKSANPELTALWAVGQRIWQRDFPGIYTAIAAFQWSENILPVMESLRARWGVWGKCFPKKIPGEQAGRNVCPAWAVSGVTTSAGSL
ncbi:hypothetical protein CRUP_031269 [Coryphaenoides rupestris]|nr:hypothetical protein CRUP_031269 [Coryphaenoides rupestris]